MLFEERGTDTAECVTAKGSLRLWMLAPNVYVTVATGHLEQAHAEITRTYGERRIAYAAGKKLCVFHDWIDMTGYDSTCRKELTTWAVQRIGLYQEIHVCLRSKLAAMGLEVASLAMSVRTTNPSLIRTHALRTRMEGELVRVLRETQGAPRG